MTTRIRAAGIALASVFAGIAPATAQVIANPSFEGGSTAGWTLGGTGRVGPIQATHLVGGAIPGGIPDGTWFAVLSTTPSQTTAGGTTAQIDANTTAENDIATLAITVSIPFWPAALEFDWTFPSSEQDQPGQFDDLFDVMVYQGTAPTDPTVNNRLFARSAPRNVPEDFSNFTNAHFLGTATVNWTINRTGSPVTGTSLRYGAAEFRRACVGIDLPEFPGPPYTRTIRFRVADQGDRQFDSALFLDRVQVVPRCNPAGQLAIVQRTSTTGADVRLKNGGVQFRPVQGKRLALDPTGRVQAVATNANLDGTNPNFVEQVFIKVDEAGWQRVAGLAINDGGEVQALALSGTVGTVPGRYLAIAARTTEAGNVEIYRWDRQLSVLATLTSTAANVCENANPAINLAGTVVAYESTCNLVTGAGGIRRLKVWTGGAANNGGAIQGAAGTCTGRNPALHGEAGAASGMVAFESNCAHAGTNADNNTEIYRYRWTTTAVTGGTFVRVTNTAGSVLNASPQMDRSANGDVFFLSSLDRAGLHVFQYDCSAVACGTATTMRWTDGPATQTYLSLRKLVNPANTNESQDFVFERLNAASFTTEVGHRIGPTGQENVITIANPVINLVGGLNGTVPVFGFLSNEDLLVGQNADGNREVFTVRVELP